MTENLISGIEQIHISVADLDVAVNFYHHVLGLPLQFVSEAQNMAFLSCGEQRLYLGKSTDPGMRSSPMLYFKVEDIEAACEALKAQGIAIESGPLVAHRTESLQMWLAGFRDPDNNLHCLTAYTEIRG